MSKYLVLLVGMMMVLGTGLVYGYSTTADITVTVKVQKLSVEANPLSYDFSTLTAGQIVVASSYIAVTNNGNVTEKYSLGITGEPNQTWASVTEAAPGAEQYRLSGIFKDTVPDTGDFLASDSFSVSTARTASSTDLAKDGDDPSLKGYSVAQDGGRNLWFKFEAPSTTAIVTEQSITARITASAN